MSTSDSTYDDDTKDSQFCTVPQQTLLSGKTFNNMTQGITLVRFFHKNMTHRKQVWKEGKNILNDPFNPYGLCKKGGLYFSSLKCLAKWHDLMAHYYIARVSVPDHARVWTDCGLKFKSDILVVDTLVPVSKVLLEFVDIDLDGNIWMKQVPDTVNPDHLIFALLVVQSHSTEYKSKDDSSSISHTSSSSCSGSETMCPMDLHKENVTQVNRRLACLCYYYYLAPRAKMSWEQDIVPKGIKRLKRRKFIVVRLFTLEALPIILAENPDSVVLFDNLNSLFLSVPTARECEIFQILVDARYAQLSKMNECDVLEYFDKIFQLSNERLCRYLRQTRLGLSSSFFNE